MILAKRLANVMLEEPNIDISEPLIRLITNLESFEGLSEEVL